MAYTGRGCKGLYCQFTGVLVSPDTREGDADASPHGELRHDEPTTRVRVAALVTRKLAELQMEPTYFTCVVIADLPSEVAAAVAAGVTAFGFAEREDA